MLLGTNVELNLYNINVNNVEMYTTKELDSQLFSLSSSSVLTIDGMVIEENFIHEGVTMIKVFS